VSGADFAAAVERLRRHFAARTDGECPYRQPNEHDPETAFQWNADLYRMDSEAVIRRYLTRQDALADLLSASQAAAVLLDGLSGGDEMGDYYVNEVHKVEDLLSNAIRKATGNI
jgi:hypothetical protein